VPVRVSEVRAVENHRAVEQRFAVLAEGLEFAEQVRQQLHHVPLVHRLELGELLLRLPVVRQIVTAVGRLHLAELDGR